jgi:hypothetical protein
MTPEEQRALDALQGLRHVRAAMIKYDPRKERRNKARCESYRKTEGDIRFHYGSLHMNNFTKWSANRRAEYKDDSFTAYYDNLKPEYRADIKKEYLNNNN